MLLVGLWSLGHQRLIGRKGGKDARLKISIPGIKTGCDSSSALVCTAFVSVFFPASDILNNLDGNALEEI